MGLTVTGGVNGLDVDRIERNEVGRRDGSVDGDGVGVFVGCPEGKLIGNDVGPNNGQGSRYNGRSRR